MIEEKLESETQVSEEQVELTEEDVKKVNQAIKQAQLDATKLSPRSRELYEQMLAEAKLPIRLEDKDFQMGEQELDVRHLNRANWRQLQFREQVLTNIYLKQIVMGQTDITRLLMVIADKLGVTDIVGATDEVIEKIEAKEKEKLNKLN